MPWFGSIDWKQLRKESELRNASIKLPKLKCKGKKEWNNGKGYQKLGGSYRRHNMCIAQISKGKKKKGAEEIFEAIIAKN